MTFAHLCSRAAVIAALVFSSAGWTQQTLAPVDEAASQPEFFAFRALLHDAIARRDVAAVLAVVHKNIKNSFDGDDGIAEFRKKWKPEAADSVLWRELGAVLALGGTFAGSSRFVAPYVFSRWPENVDSFENVAIIGERVRVRAAPSREDAIVGSLSFVIVPLHRAQQGHDGWTAIRRSDGKTGYVATQYVRSPIRYRAFFELTDNRWQLVTFVAGD